MRGKRVQESACPGALRTGPVRTAWQTSDLLNYGKRPSPWPMPALRPDAWQTANEQPREGMLDKADGQRASESSQLLVPPGGGGELCPRVLAASGSSGKFVPRFVKTKKFENEEILVPIAVGLAIECFNLVIRAFHASVVDRMLPPTQDAASM